MTTPSRARRVAGTLTGLALVAVGCHSERVVHVTSTRPSIVFILTDDQRADTLNGMPTVQRELMAHGIRFDDAFVSDSLCCPSRATILTGNYAHTTGVYQNKPPYGSYSKFQQMHDENSTVATWLHDAGYTTGLFGKYLNRYSGTHVPPGWDRWVAIAGAKDPYNLYYNYNLNIDGKIYQHGASAADYSTTVVTSETVKFIRETAGPLFVYYAPYAPHTPETPAPKTDDDQAFPHLTPYRPPSFNEADVSDKPQWVRNLPRLSAERVAGTDNLRRKTYQTLLSVDRGVGAIMQALAQTNRLHNTLIVFMSDNGYSWGEHRWVDKVAVWEEDIRVPLVVRYDPVIKSARVDRSHLVVNTDIAPTFAQFAGAATAPHVEGMSFLPLLSDPGAPWRGDFLLEHMNLEHIPSFCGVRNDRYKYIHYLDGEEELYDLRPDPYELQNRASDPAMKSVLAQMKAREKVLCVPEPPNTMVTGPAEG